MKLLLLGLLGPLNAHPAQADDSPSTVRPGAKINRIFPWPPATPLMIEHLSQNRDDNLEPVHRDLLNAALLQPSPDLVVARLFRPAKLDDLWRAFATPSQIPAATFDQGSPVLRERLARALVTLDDRTVQKVWMNFFTRDPVIWVRLAGAETFASWPEVVARDQYVEATDITPEEHRLRLLAAKPHLKRLSPSVRWRVIQRLVGHIKVFDSDIKAALDQYEESQLLNAWYSDQVHAKLVLSALQNEAGVPLTQTDWGTIDAPRFDARFVGFALSTIGRTQMRMALVDGLTTLVASRSKASEFAREVLKWDAAWTLLEKERLDRSCQIFTPESATVAALCEIDLGQPGLNTVLSVRHRDLNTAPRVTRHWRPEDLAAFEARLTKSSGPSSASCGSTNPVF